jgi:hypothetical protein
MRWKLRFTPQNLEFFTLLADASTNAVDIARLLTDLLDGFPDTGVELIRRIKDAERRGDQLTRSVVDLLNRTFVPRSTATTSTGWPTPSTTSATTSTRRRTSWRSWASRSSRPKPRRRRG